MLDARLHGRVDRSDVLRPALTGIEARNDEQTIEIRVGPRKTFRPVVVSKPALGGALIVSGVREIATISCPSARSSSSETTALPK